MPQVQNVTLGAEVLLPVTADVLLRAVPSQPGSNSVAFENAADGVPALATRLVALTRRKVDYTQSSMLRTTLPIIRGVIDAQERVGSNIVEVSCSFDKNSTTAEKSQVIDLTIRAMKHQLFQAMLVEGESLN